MIQIKLEQEMKVDSILLSVMSYKSNSRYNKRMLVLFWSVLLALVIAASYFYYSNYLKPQKIHSWYKQTLEGLGYNILALPFTPMKITLAQVQKYNQKQFGDAFYDQKHKWHDYDIVLTNTGKIVTLILLKPSLLQSFFSPNRQPLFVKSFTNKIGFNLVLKDSLILNEDQKWKRKRKVFTDILNFQFIKAKIPKMIQVCQNTFIKLQKKQSLTAQETGKKQIRVCLVQHFKGIIGEIVIKLFFGCEAQDITLGQLKISQQLSSILSQARNQSSDWRVLIFGQKAYDWSLGKKYRLLLERIRSLRQKVREILVRKMGGMPDNMSSYNDLFESLFFLKQKSKSQEIIIEMQEFISQFCAFMTASTDTTGSYFSMIMYYLTKHKEQRQKLQTMIRKTFKQPSQINYYQIREIEYLDWCLSQTTRMYGPATSILLREAKSDTYIENIPILKSTGIKIELLASHYNPKIYKDPFTFKPNRWSMQDPESHPYSFGGFGSGSHSCIGKQLVLISSKIIVCILLLKYDDFEIQNEEKIEMVYRGLYQSTAFKTILTLREKTEEERQEMRRKREKQVNKMIEYQ